LPASARFCDACGAQVGAPPVEVAKEPTPPDKVGERLQRLVPKEYAKRLLATRGQVSAERRMVTILFSDVNGSTAMAEALDPEDVMEIMDGAFDVLIEPIYRYEGTLARLMGDAILAFFGAPIAHEDDPERACRAALEIVEGAQAYGEKLQRERGISGFNVRVGINTGLVVVGEVGSDLRVEYTAMGDAINLAARMESAAEPGTILITEDTHRLIAPLFETEALGPLQVKGKAEPVSVYRVLAAKAAPGKVRGIAGLESPLVGRDAELAALRGAVERLEKGVGGVVTVVGEAGIGKSRLVEEVQKETSAGATHFGGASHLGHPRWVEARCLSYGTSIAYLLWLDVLRGLLGVAVEEGPEDVREALRERVRALSADRLDNGFNPVEEMVYPYLARLMSLPVEPELEARLRDLEGEQLKASTFQAVERLLQAAARERPLVLVLEDLHWADPTSLELLEQLLTLTDRASLLLICIFRPRRECGCWQIREVAARDYPHRHTDVWLEPLSSAEGEVLVSNLLRAEGIPAWFRERILNVAEGNPFFVEEVLRGLIDQGVVVAEGVTGRWRVVEAAATVRLPETLQGALVARIDRLQEDTKRILQMAAVIGRIFLYRVLEAIAAEERELDQRLLTLQREEMIRERARIPELEYIFKHELTREAAYNGLLKRERRAFHRQVAGALERLFPERVEELLGLLAYHWERAGDAERATEYLVRAGDQARLAYAHQEAVDYYRRALAFLEEQGDHEGAARTLMKLGLTHHNAFQFRQARVLYERGFALWQRAAEMKPYASLPPAPHSLRVAEVRPSTLDPAMAGRTNAARVIGQLFSGLVEQTPEMEIVPDAAQRWEISQGGRMYVFHLRNDVRWSDGAPVTAGDFEYAWKRVLDPSTDSPFAELLYDIKGARAFHRGELCQPDLVGVRALDDVRLAVELQGPSGQFLHVLGHNATYPVPRHAVEAYGKAWTAVGRIVTNGPFRLESWQRGEAMVLAANPDYHGPFRGNVQRVELTLLQEWSAILEILKLEMYAADDLDIVATHAIAPPEMDRARQRHAGEYVSGPWLQTTYVSFDASRPPFDDPRVRHAFALATDREILADVVLKGYWFPASGGFVPPGMLGHSTGIGLAYDLEGARQFLAEAGYPGGEGFPHVNALTWAWPHVREYLQAQWCDGLGVEIPWETTVDVETFKNRLQGERPHLILSGMVAVWPDPDHFLRGPLLATGWQNSAYDGLVAEARRVAEQSERVKLYRQAEQILAEEVPILPLTYGRRHMLVKPWVSNFPTSPMPQWFLKDVVIESH
jgi:ABC-type oligopeptide transport system substrate-binding subunit/class 3 adenylate cyclase